MAHNIDLPQSRGIHAAVAFVLGATCVPLLESSLVPTSFASFTAATANLPVGRARHMQFEDATAGLVAHVGSMTRGSFAPSGGAVVERDVALDLWDRMTQLPYAEQMRCHLPRYGLALACDGEYCWFASICWKCNNIYVSRDGVSSVQTFDGKSTAARHLLSSIRELLGDPDSDIDV